MHFLAATALSAEHPKVDLNVHKAPSLGSFVLIDAETSSPVVRGEMEIIEAPDLRRGEAPPAAAVEPARLSTDFVYARFWACGYEYNDRFQLLTDVVMAPDHERVSGKLQYQAGPPAAAWVPLLDGMLQMLLVRDVVLTSAAEPVGMGSLRLPTFVQKCVLSPPGHLQPASGSADVVVDPATRTVHTMFARIEGLQTRRSDVGQIVPPARPIVIEEQEIWVPLHAVVDLEERVHRYSAVVQRAVTRRLGWVSPAVAWACLFCSSGSPPATP